MKHPITIIILIFSTIAIVSGILFVYKIFDALDCELPSANLPYDYYQDGTNVFAYGSLPSDSECSKYLVEIKYADIETFEPLSFYYSKDKNRVYYTPLTFGSTLSRFVHEADPETFEVINNIFGKDQNNVYYEGTKIEGADPETFDFEQDIEELLETF